MEIVYQDQVDDMTAAMQGGSDKYPQLDGVFCDNADIADLYLDMKKDETKGFHCDGWCGCHSETTGGYPEC